VAVVNYHLFRTSFECGKYGSIHLTGKEFTHPLAVVVILYAFILLVLKEAESCHPFNIRLNVNLHGLPCPPANLFAATLRAAVFLMLIHLQTAGHVFPKDNIKAFH
jgi:hypothetical protein